MKMMLNMIKKMIQNLKWKGEDVERGMGLVGGTRHFRSSLSRQFPLSPSRNLIPVPVHKLWTVPLIRGFSSFRRGLNAPYDVCDVDWRQRNALTPVKDQGDTRACVIFSIVASVESLFQIQTGNLVELSVQHVMNRLARKYSRKMLFIGDFGVPAGDVFDCFKFKGVTTEESLSYKGIVEAINSINRPFPDFRVKYFIDDYQCITGDPDMVRKMMLKQVALQPFVVAVDASTWPLRGWNEDKVYSGPPTFNTNHLVVVSGCGVHTDSTPFWLVRNSFGTEFGHNGYVKIKLGDNSFGIETMLMFPLRFPDLH